MTIKQLSGLVLSVLVFAQFAVAAAAEISSTTVAPTSPVPTYKPPLRGAPASRVGGGSRGVDSGGAPRIAVLAPDHTGLTAQEQPDLYWYLSKPVATKLEITVINDQAIQPLVEAKLDTPTQAGIQRLRLRDLRIHLKPGIEYRWFVGMVADPRQRSSDIIASGTIMHNVPPPDLMQKLAKADKRAMPFIYAEEGYWYDAIATISELIAANPGDAAARRQRAALLEQAGLDEPARFDSPRP